jgi:glycosyltransferase involved in cell wall biosynthesis
MNKKLVSICIPTYNGEEFIEETLKSIIGQTYKNIEIIIGDNASTDDTCEIVEKYQKKDSRIKYYKNEINLGLFGNCNKLISMSKGEYVAIYHSDDVYDLKIIEKEVDVLDGNNDLLGVFTLYERINEYGEILKNTEYPIISNKEVTEVFLDEYINIILEKGGSCFCCPTSMIRRHVYEKLNGYDGSLKYVGDQDMWGRILLNGSMGILNEKLISYRIHSDQLSTKYLDTQRKGMALPLKHIKSFITNNLLEENYKDKLLKAEAIDCMYVVKLAVNRQNYKGFYEKLMESRQIYNLGCKTQMGIMQNLPIPRLTYFIFKIWQSLYK